jgi:hypothetical protein
MKTKTTIYLAFMLVFIPFWLSAQTPDTTYQYKQKSAQQVVEPVEETAQYELENEDEWSSQITDEERRNMDKQMVKELRKSERRLESDLKRVDKQIVKSKHEQLKLEQERTNIKRDQKRIQEEIRKL